MLYFDTSYLVRLYTRDSGWEKVRALAGADSLACCVHGQAEILAAFHRKFREGVLTRKELGTLLAELDKDSTAGAYRWLPLSPAVVDRVASAFARLPAVVNLRAADAIHLACSADAGFSRIYSNDTRLLAAASHFGLAGENII
ncbi:MAG: type II toxin-antitoxin system VapC family toxin [Limisphaerales bacterium]